MKKQWYTPTMSQINISATKDGVSPTAEHDMTTYDATGKWWAGGVSQNK
nr:hypothetical protein [uncultured Cellulosilyticum sp.]